MAGQSKDLIILGSGPGGYVAAVRAAQLGRTVSIIEREALGGVCLNWGCIPSKALLRSAQLYNDIKHAGDFGFETGKVTIDFPRIIERSREVANKLSGGVPYLMRKGKIEVISGNGTLENGNKLVVTDSARKTVHPRFFASLSAQLFEADDSFPSQQRKVKTFVHAIPELPLPEGPALG